MANEKSKTKTKNRKPLFRKDNMLYWIAGVVVIIPIILLAIIYFTATAGSNKPVVGGRFDNSLNPAIKDTEIAAINEAIKADNIEDIEINLKSATLRVTLDVVDDMNEEGVNALLDSVYQRISETLPLETYFTNTETTKMYDLEIHIFNYIPDETKTRENWVYKIRTKTAANPDVIDNTESTPKDTELANDLLKPVE